jgi:hypothetical protein
MDTVRYSHDDYRFGGGTTKLQWPEPQQGTSNETRRNRTSCRTSVDTNRPPGRYGTAVERFQMSNHPSAKTGLKSPTTCPAFDPKYPVDSVRLYRGENIGDCRFVARIVPFNA